MLVRLPRVSRLFLAAAIVAAAAPARAADPETDAREIVGAMAEAVIGTINEGADKAKREAVFRALYVKNFDNAGIAAWAAGPAFRAAQPGAKRAFLETFENYVVKAYAYQLSRYKGERLRVDKTEKDDGPGRADIIVISNLVHPDPRESREIEMRWRMRPNGGRLRVSDVVIDKISMALTEKRAFAEWLQEKGGTLEGLTGKLKEKIAEHEKR